MKELNITATGGEQCVTVLQGQALPEREPIALTIKGDIKSVSAYLKGRLLPDVHPLQEVDPATAIIRVDKANRTITLDTHPNSPFNTNVVARLELSDELKMFRINERKTMTQNEVVEILKFAKVHFDDPAKQEGLLKAYKAFEYSAATMGKTEKDDRSNRSSMFQKSVTTNLPDEFKLKIPIFKGEDSKVFRVEICLDVTDNTARMWFESVELHELIIIETELILQRELALAEGLIIIYQ